MNIVTHEAHRLALQGGPPACPLPAPAWPVWGEAERRALSDVLESGRWWFGERVRGFEAAFAAFQGARHAVSCTNGTTALEMGLRALGVVEGDEVIVPPYSFIATASAVVTVGAIPVFADILPATLCLDADDVACKVTPRTRALVPVHVGGAIADMERLNALAARHGLAVLEDAAHAWGSQLGGRGAGTLGQAGTFSFQISKNLTAGEGGVLVTDDEVLAELCRSFTHCGRRKGSAWYDHDHLGSNLRLTEFQAALLLAQLGRLEDQVRQRQTAAAFLDRALADLPGLRLLAPQPAMTRRSYHMYIFRLDSARLGMTRDRFLEALNAEGVPATKGWYRPLYANGLFARAHQGPAHGITAPLAAKAVNYTRVSCPTCEQVCSDAVWLPQNLLLAPPDYLRQVADAIAKVATHGSSLRC